MRVILKCGVIALAAAALLPAQSFAPTGLSSAALADKSSKFGKRQSLGRVYGRRKAARKGRKPQVRGFSTTIGGYSYQAQDTINTYSDSRSTFSSNSSFRDPRLDTQTRAGPFDHGWFFDSGIGPNGGDSPHFQ